MGAQAMQVRRSGQFEVGAAPEAVFPLLCPVREREWLPGWEAEVLAARSGAIEEGCVFTSSHPQLGPGTYLATRHEPAAGRVEFAIFYPGKAVAWLQIQVAAAPGGRARLTWTRTYTALGAEGEAIVGAMTEEGFRRQLEGLAANLDGFLRRAGTP